MQFTINLITLLFIVLFLTLFTEIIGRTIISQKIDISKKYMIIIYTIIISTLLFLLSLKIFFKF